MRRLPAPINNREENLRIDPEKQVRSHPLKTCDKCGKPAAPQAGVDVGSKWHCGECWARRSRK